MTDPAGQPAPAKHDGANVVRVGMGQMRVETARPAANLARAVDMVARAADAGCRVVVLPECLDVGWAAAEAPALARPIPGPTADALARAARDHGLYVAAGLTERAGDLVYNAAVLLGPDGSLLLKHRKINELDVGRAVYAVGDSVGVARTPLGTIGLNVCADNFADSLALAHAQARMGARLLLSPSAWAVDADHDNAADPYGPFWLRPYQHLARVYRMGVVGVSNVGRMASGGWAGRLCIGCSLAVGPGGRVLARGPYGADAEALVAADVPVEPPAAAGADLADVLRSRGYDPACILGPDGVPG